MADKKFFQPLGEKYLREDEKAPAENSISERLTCKEVLEQLGSYLQRDVSLGKDMTQRMHYHIITCHECHLACIQKREQLGFSAEE